MVFARLCALSVLLIPPFAVAADRPFRYVATLASGQRIESDRLTNWHVGNALPQLGGKPLLDPASPFRWLRNRGRRLADTPEAYVEFTNGDRLPGVVVDYRSGAEEPYHPLPPHFIVRVSIGFEPPENKPAPEIRVSTQFVRRIVWQRRHNAVYQAGTAHYRDGRSQSFRAVRFKSGSVRALFADGDRPLDWDELAELHLPATDPWTAWFDQLAAVCTASDTRLIQAETSTGLIATASLACFTARFEGNSADPDRWVHGLQPAWSLDILWIPFREIAIYRSFSPREIPLSRIPPARVAYTGGLGGTRPLQVDRSVVGSPLRSRSVEFGWGFGVGGGAELTFELPAAVLSLRTSVCLDASAEGGGCVRPRIFLGEAKGKPLWEGPVLIGSETVVDSRTLSLRELTAEQRTLVLQIDAMLLGQPPGADPLDIRDHADWCDPLLELDPVAVHAEFEQRLARRFLAWRDWKVELGRLATAGFEISLHANSAMPGAFEPAIRVEKLPLVLQRDVMIGPRDNWLVIAATRISRRLPDPKLEVRIAGEVAGEFPVPSGASDLNDVRPLAVSLAAYRGEQPRALPIEIRQLPGKETVPVQYWAIAIAEQIPTLHELFEDAAALAPVTPQQEGTATIIADDRYSGQSSLRLTPSGRFRIDLPHAVPVRAAPGWGEARFIRLAVRKHGGGRVAIELEDARPRDEPARYDLGRGQPSYGKATRIWQDLPSDWVVVTRDLYADFGNLDVKGLLVGCPDGEAALIDHIYLARSRADFDLIPAPAGN